MKLFFRLLKALVYDILLICGILNIICEMLLFSHLFLCQRDFLQMIKRNSKTINSNSSIYAQKQKEEICYGNT